MPRTHRKKNRGGCSQPRMFRSAVHRCIIFLSLACGLGVTVPCDITAHDGGAWDAALFLQNLYREAKKN